MKFVKLLKAGEEIDRLNLSRIQDFGGDTSYALKLLRDGIVTRESRHFDSIVEMILNYDVAAFELLRLGILNEEDQYYERAMKKCLKSPTLAQDLLIHGVITKNSDYYMDAVNSALRHDWNGKDLVKKDIIDEKYVEKYIKDESSREEEELRSALSEAILTLRENGERFYDLKLAWQDKNKSVHDLKIALRYAAERLEKAGLYEDADHCLYILDAKEED